MQVQPPNNLVRNVPIFFSKTSLSGTASGLKVVENLSETMLEPSAISKICINNIESIVNCESVMYTMYHSIHLFLLTADLKYDKHYKH